MKKTLLFFVCLTVLITSVSAQRTRSATTANDSQIDSQNDENKASNIRQSARSATPARSARSTTARASSSTSTPARSARSAASTQATPARSARSTTARTASSTSTPARSARSAASNQVTPARSGRSASTPTPTRNVGRSGANTARAATSRGNTPTGTSTNTARSGAGSLTSNLNEKINTYYVEATPKEGEEEEVKSAAVVAATLANQKTCQKEYNSCMDQYCTDKSSDGVTGRCLCSGSISSLNTKELELKKLITAINLVTTQISQIPLAQQQSALTGQDFMEVLKAMTISATTGTSDQIKEAEKILTSISNDSEESSIYFGSFTEKESMRKEGDALLSTANLACSSYLDLCPDSKTQIQSGYSIFAGNDCRTYTNDLNNKLLKEKLVWQSKISEFQKKALSGDLAITNKYNAQQCSTELDKCMRTETTCGADFEYCYTGTLVNKYKVVCQNVLSQCQGVNMPAIEKEEKRKPEQTDVLWKAFVQSVLQRSQNSIQLCYEKTMECVEKQCKETTTTEGITTIVSAFGKCTGGATSTDEKKIATFEKVAGTVCGDIIKKCQGVFTKEGEPETSVWEIIVDDALGTKITD